MQQTVDMFGYGALPTLIWRSTKFAWSPSYRQTSYEDQMELSLQWAYETGSRLEYVGHRDPIIFGIIDEILEIQDDPKYATCTKETYAYVQDLGKRRMSATQTFLKVQPEQHIERIRQTIMSIYRLTDSADLVKDPSIWKRIYDVGVELRKPQLAEKGFDIIRYALSYEQRVDAHENLIQAVKQVESEGLIDSAKLFPKGGTHESVTRDVEAFDRLIYAEWESGLKTTDAKERRKEFREFLSYRQKIWDEEYARWLRSR